MLDVRLIREQPDFVKSRLATRGGEDAAKIDEVLLINQQWRAGGAKVDEYRALKKQKSEEVRILLKSGGPPDIVNLTQNTSKQLDVDIIVLDLQIEEWRLRQDELLLAIPNLPHADVPIGKDSSDNRELPSRGEKPEIQGDLDHFALGKNLKLFDLERAAKLSGSGFICFTGAGARLERALIQFMLDLHTREHGYLEMSPPFLVRRECMVGTTQLPKFEEDMYGLEEQQLFLVPTAEVPVTNFHREEILAASELPKKFAAYTPCFRREAGSTGRETRGIIRVHQFDKVELVKITTPETSYAELESLRTDAERVLQELGLHYRVIELCTGDLGFGSAKTYDIEVWCPRQPRTVGAVTHYGSYLEVSSCSNFEDFQARRMKLRFKDASGKKRLCHTLNGSGLALPRLFAALIETYQQPDGTVAIPEKLQPYFGADEIR